MRARASLCPPPPFPLQLKDYKYVGPQQANQSGGGIVIRDGPSDAAAAKPSTEGKGKAGADEPEDKQMEADEDFARQLQARMDAEARGR